ncbi:MAG TPA: hypothetical protein P5272_01825 [Caldisericia bacterium]|nr:hypothetical protein [Caldisericia bacterium]HRT37183.1 hypothetical protein [Caldisericia bacterium]HRU73703.1 hypothetical protein [Caldisericia bacterium]
MERKEEIYNIHELIDEKKEEEILSLIKNDEILIDKYKSLSIMLNDLKDVETEKIPVSIDKKIIKKIKNQRRRKALSLSLSFALSILFVIILFSPFSYKKENKILPFISNKQYKYTISNYVTMNNINNVEITLYLKDEFVEEKSGYLKIPKEEFNLLFETLNEKGDLVINRIEGSGEKTDYINIKINYKNNPKISFVSLIGYILPYVMIAIIMLLPLPFLLKRYKKWKSY